LLNSNLLKIPADRGAAAPTGDKPLTLNNTKIKYELLFKPNTDNQPAIDTVLFDDITFYYYAAPKIVSWRYEQ